MSYRMGIDIGGTFTDFALIDDTTGTLATHKQLHYPQRSVGRSAGRCGPAVA